MSACRCRIAGSVYTVMICQISIQIRECCTSTANRLTFVFTSTLTYLKHPPSVWPWSGNVNTVWQLLIDKTHLILSFIPNISFVSASFNFDCPPGALSGCTAGLMGYCYNRPCVPTLTWHATQAFFCVSCR